jgi:hypothetical protein
MHVKNNRTAHRRLRQEDHKFKVSLGYTTKGFIKDKTLSQKQNFFSKTKPFLNQEII